MDTSENNFRDFFKNNIDFLFVLDLDGNIVETNNAVNSILGYSNEDIADKNVLLVHPAEFRDDAAEIIKKMISGEKLYCSIPLITKGGKFIPVETRVFRGIWNSKQAIISVSRNLTELKLSEEKFYSVFNHSHLLMAINTINSGVFVNVNQQFLDTLGYTKDEILGSTSKELDLFYDYSQRQKAREIFAKEGRLENYEVIIKTKSGELLNCLFSLDKIEILTYEFILTSAINITQQKKAELKIEYLYKQQKLLADISSLLNSTTKPELILDEVLKLVGEHTNVSRVYIFENVSDGNATRNTFEWCNEGIVPQRDELQEVPYDIIPSWKKILFKEERVFSTNISDLPDDLYQILEPQGIKSILVYPLFVQCNFYGFIGYDECVINRIWTTEEMDLLRTVSNLISNAFARRFVMAQLKNSELRLELALHSAKEGLWDWNNETDYVYFNDTWCKMLGYEPEDIEPNVSSWAKLVHPDDMPMVMEVLEKHLKGQTEYYETIHRIKTKDGNWKWILDHGMVIERNDKQEPTRTIGTHIDITHQKETEQKLQELVETKDKLFSIISHDLRGPIGNFIPVLELLSGDTKMDENSKNKFIEQLKKATEATFSLLENLLNWSRSQTNSISIQPVQFLINKVINDNIELLLYSTNQKSIEIILKIDEDFMVYADPDSINLVVRNILSNAIKFTPNKGTIIISAIDNGRQIEVEIADNGVGMKKETLDNLFTSRTFNTTLGTNNERGSGLGLFLSKDFIEKNGGQIRVESVLGKGSKFIFTIPKAG
jgi:PAS domain S-box-containing protein